MIQFERFTGCRPDEVCRLRPCDIQDKNGDVWICQLLEHKTEHHGKKRFIAIGPKAQEVLLALGPRVPGMNYFVNQRGRPFNTDTFRRAITGHKPIFCTLQGGRINPAQIREKLPKLALKAGITKRVHPHGLRHTGASEMVEEGISLTDIQGQLGHSSAATTDRYLHSLNPVASAERLRNRIW